MSDGDKTGSDSLVVTVVEDGARPDLVVSIDYISWEDEDDDSVVCPGQDMDGVPESGEFGSFNIHLRNTGSVDIDDQGCDVTVTNFSLGHDLAGAHEYPQIPGGGGAVGAVSPWQLTGNRIPCDFTGWVRADVTVECGDFEVRYPDYDLFDVVAPNETGGSQDECEAPEACLGPVCLDSVTWQDEPGEGGGSPTAPNSCDFGNFNVHLRNTSGSTIPDQGCRVRVTDLSIASNIRDGFEDYPTIPSGQVGAAVAPWHLTGDRINCSFAGCVTGAVTISCEGYSEHIFEDYPLFEVNP